MPDYLPWIVTAITLYAAYRNAKGDLLVSQGIWLVCNLFWLYMDVSREIYAQAFVYCAFLLTNIFGLYTGLTKKNKDPSNCEGLEY